MLTPENTSKIIQIPQQSKWINGSTQEIWHPELGCWYLLQATRASKFYLDYNEMKLAWKTGNIEWQQ